MFFINSALTAYFFHSITRLSTLELTFSLISVITHKNKKKWITTHKRLLSKFEIYKNTLECQAFEVRIPNAMYATTGPQLTEELSKFNFHTNIIFFCIQLEIYSLDLFRFKGNSWGFTRDFKDDR